MSGCSGVLHFAWALLAGGGRLSIQGLRPYQDGAPRHLSPDEHSPFERDSGCVIPFMRRGRCSIGAIRVHLG